jgi:ribosomal protein S18 acetylase RimI-like enzyme
MPLRRYLRRHCRFLFIDLKDLRDLHFLFEAQQETWRRSYGRMPSNVELNWLKRAGKRARISACMHISLLCHGGRRVGYFWFEKRSQFVAVILDIYVSPHFRRQGLGQLLLSRAVSNAKRLGCRVIFLRVAKDNEAAKKLYSHVGFHEHRGSRRGGRFSRMLLRI